MKLTAETLDNYISLSLEEKMKQFAVLPMTRLDKINDDITARLDRIEKSLQDPNKALEGAPAVPGITDETDSTSTESGDTVQDYSGEQDAKLGSLNDTKSEVKAVSEQNKVLAKLTNGINATGKYMKGMTSKITKTFKTSLSSGIKSIMSESAFGPKEMFIFLTLMGLVRTVDNFLPKITSNVDTDGLKNTAGTIKSRLDNLGDVLQPIMQKIEVYFGAIKKTMDAVFGPINRLLADNYFINLIKKKLDIPDYWGQNQAGAMLTQHGGSEKFTKMGSLASFWKRQAANIVDTGADVQLTLLDTFPNQLKEKLQDVLSNAANKEILYWAIGKQLDPDNIDDLRIFAAATGEEDLVHWATRLPYTQNKQLQDWYRDKGGKGINVKPFIGALENDIDPNLLTHNPYNQQTQTEEWLAWGAAHNNEAATRRTLNAAIPAYADEHWNEMVEAHAHPGQYKDSQGNWVGPQDLNSDGTLSKDELWLHANTYNSWAGNNPALGLEFMRSERTDPFLGVMEGNANRGNVVHQQFYQYFMNKSAQENPGAN